MHTMSAQFVLRLTKTSRRLGIGATALTALALSGGVASAAGLIEPLSNTEVASVSSTKGASPQAIRDQLVRIDLGYLESNLVPRGIDKERDRLSQVQAGGAARIDLFPGVSVTLDRSDLEKAQGGGFVWSGDVRGGDGGYAILVISGDQVTGQIQSGNRTYRISPVDGGVHRVSEIDMSKFPGDIVVPVPELGIEPAESAPQSNPEVRRTIRVLMPYTKKANQQSGNIGQDANLAISLANKAAKKGGAGIKYKLAGILKIKKYMESSGSFSTDLSKVAAGAGVFAPVHTKRNKKKADLVAMLRNSGSFCGIGYFVRTPSSSTSGNGFTVTAVNCVTNHSVAHEMGHNSGLTHDRYVVSPTPPNSEYHFGYVNKGARQRSVMAYNTECSDNSYNCTRVPMFSTPKKKYNGKKMGIAKGKPGAADAARRLRETKKAISKYR